MIIIVFRVIYKITSRFKIDAQLSQYSNVYGGLTLFSHLESEDDFVRCLLNSTYYYSAVC